MDLRAEFDIPPSNIEIIKLESRGEMGMGGNGGPTDQDRSEGGELSNIQKTAAKPLIWV